ncbi:MAG: M48 family metallopeptidase [Phycisphaerales bacterium]|nr:M48 family metallopeptidase [Phycisphaerales bacterium]
MNVATTNVIAMGDKSVEYAVKISPTARRARIRVSPAGVQVTVPRRSPDSRASSFLRENADWVLEQLRFVQRAGSLRTVRSDGPAVTINGRRMTVRMVEDPGSLRFPKVSLDGDVITIRLPVAGKRDASAALERWIRRQARSAIRARVEFRAREMRRRPGKLFVMGQRTKWGNCSRHRNISINWRLIMAPPEVLDYVVVHELAHLIEPYHSPKFWLVVASFCEGYARHRQWLKENGSALSHLPHPQSAML